MWLWIGIGLGTFFALSVLVGLALAAMLGAISAGVTELHEAEAWAVAPMTARRRSRLRLRPHRLVELELRP